MGATVYLMVWTLSFGAGGLTSATPSINPVPEQVCETLGDAAIKTLNAEPNVSARFACISEQGQLLARGG